MAKNIVKAAGLLFIINICVKLLGFGREMAIANVFGASFLTDAYLAAYTLPYFFQSILGYSFISAILPELSACWVENGDNSRACRLGSTLLNIIVVGMAVLSLLGILGAEGLIRLTAPGLDGDTAVLAVRMTRIIFPSMMFISAGLVISAILNARYRFSAAAFAPGICSICIITSAMVFSHGNIYILALGTLIGFIAFFALQLADLPRTGFKYIFCWDFKDPAVKRVMVNIVPIVLSLSVTQIYTIVNRIFASGLSEGSISALNYANKLMNLPLGVFVAAIITVAFPALAEKAQQTDKTEFVEAVKRGLSMILVISLPSALGLMMLSPDIISLLFESGSFTAESTAITSQALVPMAPGLIFLAMSMLLIRVYVALREVKIPLLCGAVSISVNVLASLLLIGPMGNAGLSLANTIASAVNGLMLLAFLAKKMPLLSKDSHVIRVTWQSLAACVVMAALVALGILFWPDGAGKLYLAVKICVLIAAAVVGYFIVLKLLRCPVLSMLREGISRKAKGGRR